jgi:threonine aldolase
MGSNAAPFDFRSDTVTRPTPAMLEAITTARVGVSSPDCICCAIRNEAQRIATIVAQ